MDRIIGRTEEDYKLFKKVATRFLKECGLYKPFMDYMKDENTIGPYKINQSNWYRKKYIDDIFGKTCFTFFIKHRKKHFPHVKVTSFFRYYLDKKYPNKFDFGFTIENFKLIEDENNNLNLETDVITYKLKEKTY